jgi:hypothetical protein
MGEDRERLLSIRQPLLERGYSVAFSRPNPKRFRSGDRMKVRLSQRNRNNVDLFLWYPQPDGTLDRINYIRSDRMKGRDFPASWALPVTRGKWEGLDVAIPAEPEKLAAWRFGKDWRTPKRTRGSSRFVGSWAEEHP